MSLPRTGGRGLDKNIAGGQADCKGPVGGVNMTVQDSAALLGPTPLVGVEPRFVTRSGKPERLAPTPFAGVEPRFVTRSGKPERLAPTPLAGVEPRFNPGSTPTS